MSNEDLPSVHNIGEGDAAVLLPFLHDFQIIDEDNKVLGLALVKDLGGGIGGAHIEVCFRKVNC